MWAAAAARGALAPAPLPPPPVVVAPVVVVPTVATLTNSLAAASHFNDLVTNPNGLPTSVAALKQYVVTNWANFALVDGDRVCNLGQQLTRRNNSPNSQRTWTIIVDDLDIYHYGPSGA